MKKLISLLAVLVICLAALIISASAATVASGTCGSNVAWELSDKGVLTITGSGTMRAYSANAYPWYSLKDAIVKVVIKDGVSNVAASAFSGAGGYGEMKEVVIPASVTSIGNDAFSGCKGLVDVTFTGTSKLTSIGTRAFKNCDALTSFTLPASVTSLGSSAFVYCSNLAEVTFAPGSALTTIGSNAFEGNEALASITIPAQVKTIDSRAFWLCTALEKVSVAAGSKLETLEYGAFQDCSALQTVNLPESLNIIEENVFRMCRALKTVNIPANVTEIGDAAFLQIWGDRDYTNSVTVTVPAGSKLISIGERAFAGCQGKMDINLPESLTTVKEWAFGYCTGLTEINVPAGVTALGSNAFAYCDNLTDIYYGGTEAQWTALTEEMDGLPESAQVHFGALTITKQPAATYRKAGATAKFNVTAVGSGLKYQWQYRTSSTGTWKSATATGNKTATLSVPATTSRDGYQYRCKITDAAGKSVTSKAVTLRVLGIAEHPDNASTAVGGTVKFTVEATGKSLTYQWQYRASATGTWRNSGTTGNKTATLTVTTNIKHDGYQYRCKVTDGSGNVIYSNKAALTVVSLSVTAQPADVSLKAGATAKFTVVAEGSGLTYQWQYRTAPTGTWKSATATGNKTATLSVPATVSRNGYQYRCKVTDGSGSVVYSDPAALTVFGIATQPKSVDAAAGTTAKFTVKATGEGLTYQWQYRTTPTGTWKSATATGNKTATLKVPATASRDGYQYRCVIKDGSARSVTSTAVTLNVE